jgi:hypothetical protein
MDSAIALADLITFFGQAVKRIFEAVGKFGEQYDARLLEAYVEDQMKAVGALILETAWRLRMKSRSIPATLPCACGHVKHGIGKRPVTVRGVIGPLELDERYYYHCDHCNAAEFIGDELRGASEFTPLAEERIALAGKDGAFERSAKLLKRLGIIAVAGSTVRKICVRLGRRIRLKTDHEAAQQHTLELKPEEQPQCLAVGVDGTMLGRVDPQHRRRRSRKTGRKVRGKGALKNFFHEVKTLVIFSFDASGQAVRKTFHATQARVEEFRDKVALEATKRGAAAARTLIFLGDGAPWVWKTAAELFPKAIQILDWYHAVEHLWAVGRLRFGSEEKALWAWIESRKSELWDGKLDQVVEALRTVSQHMGSPDQSLSQEARERDPRWIAHRAVGYFDDNRSRMDYPQYRAGNLPIGSGIIESSCKHVVGDRLKRTGMRWDEEGAEDLLALRCLDLNERWDTLWPFTTAA